MLDNTKVQVGIVITTILIMSFLSYYKTVKYTGIQDFYTQGLKVTTVSDINKIKNILNARIDFIHNNSSFLKPIKQSLLDNAKEVINDPNFNINQIPALLEWIPGNTIGFPTILPASTPDNMIPLQLEYGRTGWYWLYGTFPETKDAFLMCFTRVEMLPPDERSRLGYQVGETTLYQLTVGISHQGKNYYSDYITFPATFTMTDQYNFSFVSTDDNIMFANNFCNSIFAIKKLGFTRLQDNLKFTVNNFTSSAYHNKDMYFNLVDGCEPCGLSNNLYQSYTDLIMTINYNLVDSTNNSTVITNNNGFGWMDHQWGSGDTPSNLTTLLNSVLTGGALHSSLPPYVWINLKIGNNIQYMIYTFLSKTPKKGDQLECAYNLYKGGKVKFWDQNPKAKVNVLETININNVDYPTVYQISVDGNTYTLDTRPYGSNVFIDIQNADHWGTSGDLFDDNLNPIGTGFTEAQRFENEKVYTEKLLQQSNAKNIDLDNYLSLRYNNLKYFSLSMFILLFILVILLLVISFRHVRKANTIYATILFVIGIIVAFSILSSLYQTRFYNGPVKSRNK